MRIGMMVAWNVMNIYDEIANIFFVLFSDVFAVLEKLRFQSWETKGDPPPNATPPYRNKALTRDY